MFRSVLTLLACLILGINTLHAELKGKIDIGPALIELDILESGKTIDRRRLRNAWKGDLTLVFLEGWFVRPGFLVGEGKHHTHLTTYTVGIGHVLPLSKSFWLWPSVGITSTDLHTHINRELFGLDLQFKEKFVSHSVYVGSDFTFKINDCWTILGAFQYIWCRTDTKIRPLFVPPFPASGLVIDDKSHSSGPNYSLGIDYTLSEKWSINFGVGYNISLSREKHGLRGKGLKLGVAHYF